MSRVSGASAERKGHRSRLARRHHVHRRSVRQALAAALPPPRRVVERAAPAIDPQRATIRRWLSEDLSAPRKQRHTALRIWQRFVDEQGALLAESTVRRHVRAVRRQLGADGPLVSVPQTHPPGVEAEVDFGEARVIIADAPIRVAI